MTAHPPSERRSIEVRTAGAAAFVFVTDDVDAARGRVLVDLVDELVWDDVRRVVVDLSCVTAVDAGSRGLVDELSARRSHGVTVTGGSVVRLRTRFRSAGNTGASDGAPSSWSARAEVA